MQRCIRKDRKIVRIRGCGGSKRKPCKSNPKFRQCPFLEVPRWPKRNDPFTDTCDIWSITDAIIPTPAVMAAVPLLLLSHALFMSKGLLPSAPPPVWLHFALAPFLIHASRQTGRCFQHAESHPAGTALGWPSANGLHGRRERRLCSRGTSACLHPVPINTHSHSQLTNFCIMYCSSKRTSVKRRS